MFPFLLGAFAGKTFAEIVFSRAVMLMFVWLLLPWAASSVAIGELHAPWAGYAARFGTILAMLAFAATPRPGPTRLALLEGLTLWGSVILLIAVVRVIVHILGLGLLAGVTHEVRWIGFGMAAVAVATFAQWRIQLACSGEEAA